MSTLKYGINLSISYRLGYNGSFYSSKLVSLIGSFKMIYPIIGFILSELYSYLTVTRDGMMIVDYILNLSCN